MVAIGRALVASPRMLLLDEPSLGLAPIVTKTLFAALAEIAQRTPILLVEQNTALALRLCSRACVMVAGKVVLTGSAGTTGNRVLPGQGVDFDALPNEGIRTHRDFFGYWLREHWISKRRQVQRVQESA